jgi:hypothetical protein
LSKTVLPVSRLTGKYIPFGAASHRACCPFFMPLSFDHLSGTTEERLLAVQFGEKNMDKEFNK